jgi:hypothetical protein
MEPIQELQLKRSGGLFRYKSPFLWKITNVDVLSYPDTEKINSINENVFLLIKKKL